MLRELRNVRQDPNDRYRRWFEDDYFDLIVWYEDSRVYGFQLCYDTQALERALTWVRGRGYSHNRIDAGDRWNRTPILDREGLFDSKLVAEKFRAAAVEIDPEIAELVYRVLQEFPGAPETGRR